MIKSLPPRLLVVAAEEPRPAATPGGSLEDVSKHTTSWDKGSSALERGDFRGARRAMSAPADGCRHSLARALSPSTLCRERTLRDQARLASALGPTNPCDVVASATATLKTQLQDSAKDPDAFRRIMSGAYGAGHNAAAAESIRQRIVNNDFSWLPAVSITSDATLKGGIAAYAAEGKTVYLSEFILRRPDIAAQALAEEVGHHLDTIVNKTDAPGDEGEMFRRLLSGEELSPEEQQRIKDENDHGSIIVDGKTVEVEFWNPVKAVRHEARSAGKWIGHHGTAILGGIQAAGGAVEIATGAAIVAGAGWTGAGAVVGGAIAAHGVDTTVAGVRTAATGRRAASVTEDLTAAAGEAAGMSPEDARRLGIGVSTAIGVAGGGAAGGVIGGAEALGGSVAAATDGTLAVVAGVEVTASEVGAAVAGAIPGTAAAAAMASDPGGGSLSSWARKSKLNANSPTTQQLYANRYMQVTDYISKYRKASIRSEFPSEYLNMTVDEALRCGGSKVSKLLVDGRFVK